MKSKEELLYVLRLWQDTTLKTDAKNWRASLKKINKENEAAQYFHSIESLTKFIRKNTKEVDEEK